MPPFQTIMKMPLGEEHGRPHTRLFGADGRILPAPWLADEFPEIAGETLPPPLDFLCHDEPIWPLLRGRWRTRLADSFLWRAGRLVLIALTIAGVLTLFWPDPRLRQAALVSLLIVWGPLLIAAGVAYLRLWSSRAKWRQPRLLLYPTDRHMLLEIHMTPLQPRDLLLAQWLRAVLPRPRRPHPGWRPGAPVPKRSSHESALRIGGMLAIFIVVFLFTLFIIRSTDAAVRVALLIVWVGGAAMGLLQRAFAGASIAWIFPLPPVPTGDRPEFTREWWAARLRQWASDLVRGWDRLVMMAVFSLPFVALFVLAMLACLITWRSLMYFAAAGLIGAGFELLSRTPLIAWGQRYTRWMARETLDEFERRAHRLRARQLALLDAGRPLPKPR